MQDRAQEFFNKLDISLGDDPRISLKLEQDKDHSRILVGPSSASANSNCAQAVFGIHRDYDLTVDIGRGNHFDVPEAFSDEQMAFLLDIINACIAGGLEEVVTVKNGNVLKSRIKIMLSTGKTTFTYRRSLFRFGGKKSYIKYQPYPSPSDPFVK